MKQEKVSIITPVYNGERFLRQAIESVLFQAYDNWEYILVNDGSEDSSKKIIEEYLHDPRCTYIEHSSNQGIPSARNTGITNSSGAYIAFLDQDDLWLPEKIEKQAAVLQNNPGVGLVSTDYEEIDEDGAVIAVKSVTISSDLIMDVMMFENSIKTASLVLIRRECFDRVGLFDEALSGEDDVDMYIRIAEEYEFSNLNDVLVQKREHDRNSAALLSREMFQDHLKIIDRMSQKDSTYQTVKDRAKAAAFIKRGRYLYSTGKLPEAKKMFSKAARCSLNVKTLMFLVISLFGRPGFWIYKLKKKFVC